MNRRPLLAALLAVLPVAPAAAAVGTEPGTWWEQTVEMQMTGFAMPAQTMRVCMPKKSWEEPPSAGDAGENCRVTDLKRSGTRMTWKIQCADGLSGTGDLTTGPDAFQGAMTMNQGGQVVRTKVKGKRVGGDCDAKETERRADDTRKMVEEQQAMQAEEQAQACADAVAEMQIGMFVPMVPGAPVYCADRKAEFCKRLETRAGFIAFRTGSGHQEARGQAEQLCRKKLADVEKRLCAEAAAEQSRGRRLDGDAVEFVFGSCPEQAKALAKTECAGRSYTSMPEAQRDFCTAHARETLDRGEPAPRPTSPAVPDVKRELIRGIFGR